mmetsp:Transcript_91388/g.263790  ORF Transcript_91388/g.263790 Transcript_91388/m.263790 type:complete len:210 (+) Transcript_91388:120-749(+)
MDRSPARPPSLRSCSTARVRTARPLAPVPQIARVARHSRLAAAPSSATQYVAHLPPSSPPPWKPRCNCSWPRVCCPSPSRPRLWRIAAQDQRCGSARIVAPSSPLGAASAPSAVAQWSRFTDWRAAEPRATTPLGHSRRGLRPLARPRRSYRGAAASPISSRACNVFGTSRRTRPTSRGRGCCAGVFPVTPGARTPAASLWSAQVEIRD